MEFKSTHRLLRAFLARFVCLFHIALSIFMLYSVKKDLIYLIPIVGAVLLLIEALISLLCLRGKEPFSWISTSFFIYVTTIVACYWFLELEYIRKTLVGQLRRDFKISMHDLREDLIGSIKVIWSQVELQIFFALVIFVRWLLPKSSLSPHGLSQLLFKYFAISCDMLDFLTIIQDPILVMHDKIVYWTLSVWSWSTIQFYVFVPKYEDEEKREFNAYLTNSLLSTLMLDLPYLGVRATAIFAFGSHNYNSYFFATKNLVMILLQIHHIYAIFSERRIRMNRNASKLKDQIGFDKEGKRLFANRNDPNELAVRNYLARRNWNLNCAASPKQIVNSTPLPPRSVETDPGVRLPRTIETVKASKHPHLPGIASSIDNLSVIEPITPIPQQEAVVNERRPEPEPVSEPRPPRPGRGEPVVKPRASTQKQTEV